MTSEMILKKFAADYQDKTSCSDEEAVQASMVAAMMFAAAFNKQGAVDHFARRVKDYNGKFYQKAK